jgi:hypothetical protein
MRPTDISRPSAQTSEALTPAGRNDRLKAERRTQIHSVEDSEMRASAIHARQLIQVLISSSGLSLQGLLKAATRGGLRVPTPLSVPLGCSVQITIQHCQPILCEVFYCVKKPEGYQVGVVFSAHHKPQIAVGSLAVIEALDEPFAGTRGNVIDVAHSSVTIFGKTTLVPGARVRVKSNDWLFFGNVEFVIATTMVASCVGVRLEAAFPLWPALPPTERGNVTAT